MANEEGPWINDGEDRDANGEVDVWHLSEKEEN